MWTKLGLETMGFFVKSPEGERYWIVTRGDDGGIIFDERKYDAAKAAGCPQVILAAAVAYFDSKKDLRATVLAKLRASRPE